jgi:hypothetical protein
MSLAEEIGNLVQLYVCTKFVCTKRFGDLAC